MILIGPTKSVKYWFAFVAINNEAEKKSLKFNLKLENAARG